MHSLTRNEIVFLRLQQCHVKYDRTSNDLAHASTGLALNLDLPKRKAQKLYNR